jgi:hypothetical protein
MIWAFLYVWNWNVCVFFLVSWEVLSTVWIPKAVYKAIDQAHFDEAQHFDHINIPVMSWSAGCAWHCATKLLFGAYCNAWRLARAPVAGLGRGQALSLKGGRG